MKQNCELNFTKEECFKKQILNNFCYKDYKEIKLKELKQLIVISVLNDKKSTKIFNGDFSFF